MVVFTQMRNDFAMLHDKMLKEFAFIKAECKEIPLITNPDLFGLADLFQRGLHSLTV
jgi:hypothetical protein